MNKALTDILSKVKAIKPIISDFEKYIQLLLQSELDYEYVLLDAFRKELKNNSWRMAIYESRLNQLSEEESFHNFCRYIHLQLEGLMNFYFTKKVSTIDEFVTEYENMFKPRLNQIMEFDYDKLIASYLIDKAIVDKNSEEDSERIVEIRKGWDTIKTKFIENKMKLRVYLTPEDEKVIQDSVNFDFLKKALKTIDSSYYTSIDRIPFQNKWDLFDYYFNVDLKFKITISGLTDFRNKVLSHSGNPDYSSLNKNAQSLLSNRNFVAVKEALIEVNNIIRAEIQKGG
jgi:hypothetical protein